MSNETLVHTEKPSPYLKQLCKHFGHKLEVDFDDDRGTINFAFGRCDLERTDGGLLLKASAGSEEELRRVEQVIGSHLVRFGRRDELEVSWPA